MMDEKNIPFLGIMMLDTNFPRVLGDAGNESSYMFPVRIHIVKGAGSLDLVKDEMPSEEIIQLFCKAAKKLEFDGAFAIISTCGFLIAIQDTIADAVSIPVMVSALSLYPKIYKKFGEGSVGVITASFKSLGDIALRAAGLKRHEVCIAGMEDCSAFSDAILQLKNDQLQKIDTLTIENFIVNKALLLKERQPNISVFLLECTNLPPYKQAIERATGCPVYSIIDVAEALMNDTL